MNCNVIQNTCGVGFKNALKLTSHFLFFISEKAIKGSKGLNYRGFQPSGRKS
jgi:hypothetical protein